MFHSVSTNGPEPTVIKSPSRAAVLFGCPFISLSGVSPMMCLGMTGMSTSDIAIHSAGCSVARLRTTVRSSGVSIDSSGAHIPVNGWLAWIASIENFTSADVIGTPSWKVAPSTRCRVTVRSSSETSHDSARYG